MEDVQNFKAASRDASSEDFGGGADQGKGDNVKAIRLEKQE